MSIQPYQINLLCFFLGFSLAAMVTYKSLHDYSKEIMSQVHEVWKIQDKHVQILHEINQALLELLNQREQDTPDSYSGERVAK